MGGGRAAAAMQQRQMQLRGAPQAAPAAPQPLPAPRLREPGCTAPARSLPYVMANTHRFGSMSKLSRSGDLKTAQDADGVANGPEPARGPPAAQRARLARASDPAPPCCSRVLPLPPSAEARRPQGESQYSSAGPSEPSEPRAFGLCWHVYLKEWSICVLRLGEGGESQCRSVGRGPVLLVTPLRVTLSVAAGERGARRAASMRRASGTRCGGAPETGDRASAPRCDHR